MTIRTGSKAALVATGGTVLLVAVLSGCGGTDVEGASVESKSFAYSGTSLTIDADDSVVDVVPADVKEIEVTRQVDGWAVLGSGPKPVWELEGDKLTFRVKCRALISNCEARHQVKVPRGVDLRVEADNGIVTATGFDTRLAVSADNGDIVVRECSGPLDLWSDNGSVRAERFAGTSVTARSDNGEVDLGFTEVPDLVDVVSDNGSITIDLPGGREEYAVSASADNGDVSVDVPRSDKSPHVVKARSDNGEVTVRRAN
ncbi:DUF4097 domain-containing protein [Streptomyces sp. NBC_01754]|uniref:DUF4097 family beta strand repeat-containing protein n=1 Tax=Streptomyces sp. NBC_01754 TaxID=2975930 RepID=UPI002DDC09E6|nr:DUF4097 family beta strand repeat-containing protein [Streptomyces sp. NBC_01754]WSC92258.1 DUF4097 domain-containing protein [Streptomyces sp. NBC_01754]